MFLILILHSRILSMGDYLFMVLPDTVIKRVRFTRTLHHKKIITTKKRKIS